ncbi:MAG: DUF3365 domain-containing protein [Clostridia bacterium]|nr:DUF3365 domain-containing protein [Clostridia bacterium]
MNNLRRIFDGNLIIKLLVPFIIVLFVSTFCGVYLIIDFLNSKPIDQEISRLRSISLQLQSIWDNMEDSQLHILRQSNINAYNAGNIVMYDALATVERFSEKMQAENTTVRISAPEPLNTENITDEWENSVVQAFRENRELLDGSEIINDGEHTYLRYAMPIELKSSCLSCHSGSAGDIYGVFSLTTSLDSIISQTKMITYSVFGGGILIILLLAFFMWFISRRVINKPLADINKQLVEMNSGEGDLTYRLVVKSEDLIGRIGLEFNRFLEYLQKMILKINSSSHELEKVAGNISSSIVETRKILAKNAEQVEALAKISSTVADNLQEVQRGSEEVANSASQISVLTQECFNEADSVREEAEESGQGMEAVVSSVEEVNHKVNQLEAVFEMLNQSFNKISGFVTEINQIASQTNLLALNAAIEASRAGEPGRGFAVVAEEVRELAELSEKSAREISIIIGELGEKTRMANDYLKVSSKAVESSREKVENVQRMLKSIINRIAQITTRIQGISAASQEQTALSEEITAAITEVTKFSNETAASSEQFNYSIQQQLQSIQGIEGEVLELEKVAKTVLGMINKFKV